jgi:hypothetical protein
LRQKHLPQRAAKSLDHGANADVCQTAAIASMFDNERISPDDIAAKVC